MLALERLYLFADTDNMTPSHVIHLEHVNVRSAHPDLIRKNIEQEPGASNACGFCVRRKKGQSDAHGFVTPTGLPPGSERSAFILTTPAPHDGSVRQRLVSKSTRHGVDDTSRRGTAAGGSKLSKKLNYLSLIVVLTFIFNVFVKLFSSFPINC